PGAAPQGYGAQPGAAPQAPGYSAQPGAGGAPAGAAHNPYAQAQSALKTGNQTLKIAQWAVGVFGGLMLVGGLVWTISGNFGGGIGLLVGGGVMIFTAIFQMPKFLGMMKQSTAMVDGLAAQSQLAQTGIPAQAQIIHVQQTGTMVNMNPQVAVSLNVTHPQTGAAYQVQTTAVVPQISIPQFQPGAMIQVRIDPTNPMNVAVVT
ncbi:MAG: hypothetical protein AAGA56_05670, partial [Myxococcota bacterium]